MWVAGTVKLYRCDGEYDVDDVTIFAFKEEQDAVEKAKELGKAYDNCFIKEVQVK